jgi:uncharacterized protein YdeI (YjbR/CyaY-like superfamily)
LRNPLIDKYLVDGCMRCSLGGTPDCKVLRWTAELEKLRGIVLDCGLEEELKWGVPCYTYKGSNILIVSAFKDYCSISFFKGVLLEDFEHILVKPGENSQAGRLVKFSDLKSILDLENILKAYIFEAVEVEKAGLKVVLEKTPEPIPQELQECMDQDPVFKNAFESLTKGRQRGYILYFSQPKQSKTRLARIAKWTDRILNGEGMHDQYKTRKR